MSYNNTIGTFLMTDDEIKTCPFITKEKRAGFYNFLREKFATPTHVVDTIDCRKLLVSDNIQAAWYDYIRKHNIPEADVTMLLLMNGPKTESTLPDNTVEIQEGCFTYAPRTAEV